MIDNRIAEKEIRHAGCDFGPAVVLFDHVGVMLAGRWQIWSPFFRKTQGGMCYTGGADFETLAEEFAFGVNCDMPRRGSAIVFTHSYDDPNSPSPEYDHDGFSAMHALMGCKRCEIRSEFVDQSDNEQDVQDDG